MRACGLIVMSCLGLFSNGETQNVFFKQDFFIYYCHYPILSECAPSTSLYVILDNDLSYFGFSFSLSGFVCHDCATYKKTKFSN